MAHQPLIQQTLRKELIDFESTSGGPPTFNDIAASGKDRLKYLDAVTMEVMRCKAVLMDISRMVGHSRPCPNDSHQRRSSVGHSRRRDSSENTYSWTPSR